MPPIQSWLWTSGAELPGNGVGQGLAREVGVVSPEVGGILTCLSSSWAMGHRFQELDIGK